MKKNGIQHLPHRHQHQQRTKSENRKHTNKRKAPYDHYKEKQLIRSQTI